MTCDSSHVPPPAPAAGTASAAPARPQEHARVAVIVPAYGVAHLLGEALTSLQRQTFTQWECVVIDDGAPDDVAGAVAPFLSDPRIRFLATANHGVSAARNTAIAASSAPLVALLDGDDLFRPGYLATVVPILETDPSVRLVTCNALIFGAVTRLRTCVDRPQPRNGTLAQILDRSFNVYIGTTFRRADFDAIGGFDTRMAQSEDFDFWVRLMMLGGRARHIDAVLGEYRVRHGSASANGGRMLLGNLRTYEKARKALPPGAPEIPLLDKLLADTRAALDFEHAIDAIVDGDTQRGLASLRSARGQVGGFLWGASFSLWLLFPSLARPMLTWRRRAHTRGSTDPALYPSFLETEG
ncbi:glycosyltransferase family A protein [Novosphingobium sp. NDB2Meth1]|uniref:glycosyltransferase family 2 protein n=1 Tax=Novosphingobium sp. NDB2Meth1 TaxID=1892847 RepID=UPI0009F9D6FB|nr:glycosyltransferase family A protein [Novosphingobium sp. NDB2Meth1]